LACILIPQIEVNLAQQLIFSVVAATGVAAMRKSSPFHSIQSDVMKIHHGWESRGNVRGDAVRAPLSSWQG
jgi:hypothetical protein